MTVNDELGKI